MVNSFILLWGISPRDLFFTQAGEIRALLREDIRANFYTATLS